MFDFFNLELVYHGHPCLRWESKPISNFNLIKQVYEKMLKLMYKHDGLGLSANQVGLPWQMFVIDMSEEKDKPQAFINPSLTFKPDCRKITLKEGCLSFPGLKINIERSRDVVVEALDLDGNPYKLGLSGLTSRAVQHEFDHLHAKLFIDHIELNEDLLRILDKLRKPYPDGIELELNYLEGLV